MLHFVRLDGIPDIPAHNEAVEVVPARPSDIAALACCLDKSETFYRRFMQGDLCLMGKLDGHVAGYMWLCTRGSHVEGLFGYEVAIAPGSVYCYDEYVSPAYRRKGVFAELCRGLAAWMRENRMSSVVSLIERGNGVSRAIHAGMGFREIRRVLCLRIFGLRYFRECALSRSRAD